MSIIFQVSYKKIRRGKKDNHINFKHLLTYIISKSVGKQGIFTYPNTLQLGRLMVQPLHRGLDSI